MAAVLAGAGRMRIIFRHMLPSFISHIIASATLALPGMILGETALSFLGLGLRPPAMSWGVLLQQAQNVQSVAMTPWMLAPVLPVARVGVRTQLARVPRGRLRAVQNPTMSLTPSTKTKTINKSPHHQVTGHQCLIF